MTVKKLLVVTLVMMMVLGLVGGVVGAGNNIPDWAKEVDLLAGQDNKIGTVYVWNDADNLYVEFQTEGYGMTETKLHVAGDPDEFPTNRSGNPIPGHFDHQSEHRPAVTSFRYTIEYDFDAGYEICIAAHASVGAVQTGNIVSDTDTLYQSETDWVNSVATWDQHNQWKTFIVNNPILAGSTWIWNAYEVAQLDVNEYVDFKRTFNINGMPMEGTLYITTDNGYSADINGGYVVSNGSWSSLQTVDVLEFLQPGENLLEVAAYNLPGTVYTSNPAGLIYNLVYSYVDVDNSAWADGKRFVDRGNWATYFCYTVPEREVWVDTVHVTPHGTNPYVFDPTYSEDLPTGTYRMEAEGTYRFANWSSTYGTADALFNRRTAAYASGEDFGDGWYILASNRLQIFVFGDAVDWRCVDTGNRTRNSNHTYDYTLSHTGGEIEFGIEDDQYNDNSGSIKVKIYKVNW